MTQFAEDLRAKLKENHMKQAELAKYLDTAPSQVSVWLNKNVHPNTRCFDMICDLFEMSRERYTAERADKRKEFHPKPIVDPAVKEKESNWKNPYVNTVKTVKPEFDPPLEEPQRCDLAIKELERKVAGMENLLNTQGEMIIELDKAVSESTQNRWENEKSVDERLKCIEERLVYIQGQIDAMKPKKSWWRS